MAVVRTLRAAALMCALAVTVGCATSRSEIDIGVPVAQAGQVVSSNGKRVSITAVDERKFELKPKEADIPSLKNGEINDSSITQRAVARKRNGYGMGLGDVLLPSGRKVSELIRDAVAEAYTQAGYEVVTDAATPGTSKVKVRVVEFWSWMRPTALSILVNNKSKLLIETDGGVATEVTTLKTESRQMVTEGAWKQITEAGLQEIIRETRNGL
ncbi:MULTISPECIES: flagellar biosynthesis protein [unclassified Pseudomonas]|uniref:flagellar biosynthesis protein n=1 Tax=unclassified Pseudomonas TaxID=196821 RepID=UPI00244D774F|nr:MULTISPECIES: flagellar biosynthesis protein [unclassified Pseudomonas]MDH0893000.1 flagellar biosynthesis protein [Pseudomonas sp. GD03875]MDH1067489.1 flagellar biosynthesis protein [Pseudomonas sp. GD03985]